MLAEHRIVHPLIPDTYEKITVEPGRAAVEVVNWGESRFALEKNSKGKIKGAPTIVLGVKNTQRYENRKRRKEKEGLPNDISKVSMTNSIVPDLF